MLPAANCCAMVITCNCKSTTSFFQKQIFAGRRCNFSGAFCRMKLLCDHRRVDSFDVDDGTEAVFIVITHSPDRTRLIIPCRSVGSVVDKPKMVDKVVDKAEIRSFLVEKWSINDKVVDKMVDILALIREKQVVRMEDIVTRVSLNASTAKRYLRRLVDMGLVTPEGENRNRKYRGA
jgi:DNA-binding transcriptional ArsR family regulator